MSLWLVNMSSQNVVYCALFTYFEFISIVPKGFPMGIWYCVECDDARWNMVLDWVEWDSSEHRNSVWNMRENKTKKNSISLLKLVVCGEIWFHSFYNFLPFFLFFSPFALLIYFHWRHSLDIFLPLQYFVFRLAWATVLYYKYSSNVWFCHVFNYGQEYSPMLEYLKKGVLFWPTFLPTRFNTIYYSCTLYLMYKTDYITNPDEIIGTYTTSNGVWEYFSVDVERWVLVR